jgi:hypothetical protein
MPDHVKAPDHGRPSERDGLKCLCCQVSLPSVKLTPFTHADNLLRIVQCGGPVKTLVKSLADQRLWCRVVPPDTRIDLEKEFLALLGEDAFHEHSYPRRAAFVKFTIDGEKRLGVSIHPLCLGSISWEDLVEEVGQKGHPPVRVDYRCVSRGSCNLHHEVVGGRLVGRH